MIEAARKPDNELCSKAHRLGWSIIPAKLDKRPMLVSWKEYQTRQPHADELKEWKAMNPPAWAVITGAVSGLVVIDFDGEPGCNTMANFGVDPHVYTGSGGYHLYCEHPGFYVKTLNSKSKKEMGELYPGVDIRADGGYAIFNGSNMSGPYVWKREMVPDPLDVLPLRMRECLGLVEVEPEKPNTNDLKLTQPPQQVPWEKLLERYLGESVNGRNDAGFNLACQLRDNNYGEAAAERVLVDYAHRVSQTNTKGQHEPYGPAEARVTVKSAYKLPARQPWTKIAERQRPASRPRTEPKEYVGLIPEGSLLDVYTHYGTDLTDAPSEFHLAVGLSVISGALGNRVWFQAWGQPVYCNLWQVILAPSGFFRKSTSMHIGLNLLRGEFKENILPNDFTKEKLLENLSNRPQGVIPVWEFGSMLKSMGMDYNGGLKELLTEIYDAPYYERQTKQGGICRIEKPAISILAASTIDWVVDRITAGDLNSGFLCRFLYWPAKQKNGWKGFNSYTDPENAEYIRMYLQHVRDTAGEVTFPPAVKNQYDKWLRKHEEEVNEQKLPAELQGFYTRISTYVLKLAVLYEMAMTQNMTVCEEAMDYAIKLAEYLKSHLVRLMQDEIVTTRDGKELKIVREIIVREPGIDRATLLRKTHMTSRHLTELLDTLLQSQEVRAESQESGTRPRMVYYAD